MKYFALAGFCALMFIAGIICTYAQSNGNLATFDHAFLHQSQGNTETLHLKQRGGATYVFGTFAQATTFGDSNGGAELSPLGNPDLYFIRYNAANEIDLSFRLGRIALIDGMSANAIEVDEDGHFYLAGSFSNTVNFNPLGDAENVQAAGGRDAFVAKYNANGLLQWIKAYQTPQSEIITALSLGADGQLYAALRFNSNIAVDDENAVILQNIGGSDAAVLALSASGDYLWHHMVATPLVDDLTCLSSRHGGGVYAGARVSGTGSPIIEYLMQAISLDADGAVLFDHLWGNPGAGNRIVGFHTFDDTNFLYIHGEIQGITDFVIDGSAEVQEITPLFRDPFVAKYHAESLELQWARSVQSTGLSDFSAGIHVNGGKLWWAGSFDFEAVFAPLTPQLQADGQSDLFLAVYNDDDGSYLQAQRIGGPGAERLEVALFDDAGGLMMGGHYAVSLGIDPEAAPVASLGNRDGFIARFTYDIALSDAQSPAAASQGMKAYPVPTKAMVHFEGSEGPGSWQLMDLTGKVLRTGQFAEGLRQIDMGWAAQGLYLVSIKDSNGHQVLRVAKH